MGRDEGGNLGQPGEGLVSTRLPSEGEARWLGCDELTVQSVKAGEGSPAWVLGNVREAMVPLTYELRG